MPASYGCKRPEWCALLAPTNRRRLCKYKWGQQVEPLMYRDGPILLTCPVRIAILLSSGLMTKRSTRDKLGNCSLKRWLLLNLQSEFDLYGKSCKCPLS